MEYSEIINKLRSCADTNYAAYQRRIVSDTAYPILGVRMPVLRKIAKQVAGDWRGFTDASICETYEGVMLCGLVIAYAPVEFKEKLPFFHRYLPFVDSWGITDSVISTLRILPQERLLLWEFINECFRDTHEYTVRFGIVLMLRFFLTDDMIHDVAERLIGINDRRYYVQMAVAWCLAEMAVQNYSIVFKILQNDRLDPFVHQKTIQKIRESYRITKEQKAAVALLRRKKYETNHGN